MELTTKIERKRWNERLKCQADFFNNTATAPLSGGFIAPLAAAGLGRADWLAVFASVVFLLGAYFAHRLCLRRVKRIVDEDDVD